MDEHKRIVLKTRNDLGKTVEIQCNKCSAWLLAYKWSITANGKRCACKNMVYRYLSSDMYYAKESEGKR